MILSAARELAIELMREHGLEYWSFEFDNAMRRFGSCRFSTKRITLSQFLVLLNNQEKVKDTILHEIAHALVGSGNGHNKVWKSKAIEIGCSGERCYTRDDTNIVKGNFEAICPKCGHIHTKFRMPKKKRSCGKCSKVFDEERRLIYVRA